MDIIPEKISYFLQLGEISAILRAQGRRNVLKCPKGRGGVVGVICPTGLYKKPNVVVMMYGRFMKQHVCKKTKNKLSYGCLGRGEVKYVWDVRRVGKEVFQFSPCRARDTFGTNQCITIYRQLNNNT